MSDKPILFSAPMVRALLDGRKTQTRRVLKPQPAAGFISAEIGAERLTFCPALLFETPTHKTLRRLARPGDRLWVREAWRASSAHDGLAPRDIPVGDSVEYQADPERVLTGKLRPSMFMPRWASRLTLIVTDVRVQRLEEISEADAIAEGVTSRPHCYGFSRLDGWSMDWSQVGNESHFGTGPRSTLTAADVALGSPVSAFAGYINALHDPRWNFKGDGIFGANPWVAAYTFSVHRCNIDALPHSNAELAS